MSHRLAAALTIVSLSAIGAGAALGSGASRDVEGGIFRISLNVASGVDSRDPALASSPPSWAVLDTTCVRLMSYPDKPPPAGFRPQPEVAGDVPSISRDGKTYIRLRPGLRFSDGSPVRASAFARAINRVLAPEMSSPGLQLVRDGCRAPPWIDPGQIARSRTLPTHNATKNESPC